MTGLRERLASGRTVWAAGIYDSLSARLAEEAGFDAVMTGGLGMTASLLGMPDFELLTLTENVGVVSRAAKAVSIPVIADIDTGYGNTVNVGRAVAEFRAAGAQAVIMEDQVSPKRCAACVDETELIPVDEASAKIRAARDAAGDAVIVIARTDSFDPAEAIARAEAYVAAGATMIQPVSKTFKDHAGLVELKRRAGVPLSIQILGWLEKLGPEEIEQIAGIATFSLVALMTTTAALRENLGALRKACNTTSLPRPRTALTEFNDFIGFDALLASQQRFYR
jgi:2-methylisocitrate lyase-like PEP mutase family enzyme